MRDNNDKTKGEKWYQKNFIILVVILSLFGIFVYTFCPSYLCYLDPSSHPFRQNPILYLYKKICSGLKYTHMNFLGCDNDVIICAATHHIFPHC